MVEIKSSRRLTKSKSSSIWGSVDLKAHADEVEDQLREADDGASGQDTIEVASAPNSVHLDTIPLPAGSSEPNDPQDASATPSTILQKSPRPTDTPKPADIGGPTETGAVDERDDPSNGEKDDDGSQTKSKKKTVKSRRRIAGGAQIARKTQASSKDSPSVESHALELTGASRDGSGRSISGSKVSQRASRDLNKDLTDLEAENRHLKKLFFDTLRKENAELKRKLGFS